MDENVNIDEKDLEKYQDNYSEPQLWDKLMCEALRTEQITEHKSKIYPLDNQLFTFLTPAR